MDQLIDYYHLTIRLFQRVQLRRRKLGYEV
jgi:hypothetical protein